MATVPTVSTVSTVSTVHEDVHERTGEQKQERQIAERMGAMLGKKQEGADRKKDDRDEGRLRTPEGRAWFGLGR